jgi:hypothetical protein
MTLRSREVARRTFLRKVGLGAGLVPLLGIGAARGATAPKRLVIVTWTNGSLHEHFWPQGSGEDLGNLKLPAITASLEPFKKDLLFIDGVGMRSFNDQFGSYSAHTSLGPLLTGARSMQRGSEGDGTSIAWPTTESIDQRIGDELGKRANLPVRSLNLGVSGVGNTYNTCVSWRPGGAPVTAEANPVNAATRLFTGAATPSPTLDKVRLERRSLLDFLQADLKTFSANLGPEDRQKVTAHLESVREIEEQIAGLSMTSCKGPAVAGGDFVSVLRAHCDLLVAAMKCDLSRVAVLQLSNSRADSVVASWLGFDKAKATSDLNAKSRNWHDIAHSPDDSSNPTRGNKADKIRFDGWVIEQFAALVRKFKEIPEGTGTMLDHSVLLLINHINVGAEHTTDRLPCVLAGSCGGAIKTGRSITAKAGATTQLYAALAQAMDVDVSRNPFGDPKYQGVLPGVLA